MQCFSLFLVKLLENFLRMVATCSSEKMGLLTELSLDIKDNSARVLA